MKIKKNEQYFTRACYSFCVVAAAILFYFLLKNINILTTYTAAVTKILSPFITGFVIAFIADPVMRFIEARIKKVLRKPGAKGRPGTIRAVSVLLTFLFFMLLFAIFIWAVLPQIIASVQEFTDMLPTMVLKVREWWDWGFNYMQVTEFPPEVNKNLNTLYNNLVEWVYTNMDAASWIGQVGGALKSVADSVLGSLLALIIAVYMLMGKERFFAQIKKAAYAILPKKAVEIGCDLVNESANIFTGFIVGKTIDSTIIGILCFLGLTVLSIPYAVFISVMVGVTNMIPYFGPFIGALPSILILLLVDPSKALVFAIFILVLQQIDGNIIGPKILGDSIGLSAFWVIFAIILFGDLMGFVGMVIGVPTFAVIYSVIRRIVEYLLAKKHLPKETFYYTKNSKPVELAKAQEAKEEA